MHLSDERAIVILLVGAIAGFLTSKLVRGSGTGLIGDEAVGIVGPFLGEWLFPKFHFHFGTGVMSLILSAAIGSTILLLLIRISGAAGLGRVIN